MANWENKSVYNFKIVSKKQMVKNYYSSLGIKIKWIYYAFLKIFVHNERNFNKRKELNN